MHAFKIHTHCFDERKNEHREKTKKCASKRIDNFYVQTTGNKLYDTLDNRGWKIQHPLR